MRISDAGLRQIKETWKPYDEAGVGLPHTIAGPVRLIVHLYAEEEATEGTGYVDTLLCRGRVYQRPTGGPDSDVPSRPRIAWDVPGLIEEVFVSSGFSGTHVRVFKDGSTMIFVNAWGGAILSWSSKTLRIGTLDVEPRVVA